MYGLLGLDNIWLRDNYLNIWNLRVQKNLNIEKIAFNKVVQMKSFAMHITNQKLRFDLFTDWKLTKYLHGTLSLFNILMIFGIKEKNFLTIITIAIILTQDYVAKRHGGIN